MPSGQVKILDFGLAHVGHSDMTNTGTILGSPNYMAPEQIRGQRIDARADIFSLGSVFYELLSGRKAFHAESMHALFYKVMHHDPEPVRAVVPSIPAAISDMIKKAMAKEPAMRFQSLAEMRNVIRAVSDRGTAVPNAPLEEVMREYQSATIVVKKSPETRSGGEGSIADAVPARVTFAGEPGGDIFVDVPRSQTLLAASLAAGIPHVNACGGNARCSTCRVVVLSNGENLTPRDSAEIKLAQRLGFTDDIRLACQTRARGAVRLRRLILDDEDVALSRSDRSDRNVHTGSETPLAVMYAGIREFAAFSRRALPYDAVHVVNRFYTQIGEAVLANGGHIDRYDGGGVLALFGLKGEEAKAKCTNAIRAALRMQKRMEPMNAYLSAHFGVTFTFEAGLHYGRMIVGHMGHPDHQRLTAIGEPAAVRRW